MSKTSKKKDEFNPIVLIVIISVSILLCIFIFSSLLDNIDPKYGIITSINNLNNIGTPVKPIRIPTKELPLMNIPVPVQPIRIRHR